MATRRLPSCISCFNLLIYLLPLPTAAATTTTATATWLISVQSPKSVEIFVPHHATHISANVSASKRSVSLAVNVSTAETKCLSLSFLSMSVSFRSLQSAPGPATSQKQSTKASGGEAALPGNLWYQLFGWGQGGPASASLRFIRMGRCGCHTLDADHVPRVGLRGEVQHTRRYPARVALRSLQALQRSAVSQLSALLLCCTNGECFIQIYIYVYHI